MHNLFNAKPPLTRLMTQSNHTAYLALCQRVPQQTFQFWDMIHTLETTVIILSFCLTLIATLTSLFLIHNQHFDFTMAKPDDFTSQKEMSQTIKVKLLLGNFTYDGFYYYNINQMQSLI